MRVFIWVISIVTIGNVTGWVDMASNETYTFFDSTGAIVGTITPDK